MVQKQENQSQKQENQSQKLDQVLRVLTIGDKTAKGEPDQIVPAHPLGSSTDPSGGYLPILQMSSSVEESLGNTQETSDKSSEKPQEKPSEIPVPVPLATESGLAVPPIIAVAAQSTHRVKLKAFTGNGTIAYEPHFCHMRMVQKANSWTDQQLAEEFGCKLEGKALDYFYSLEASLRDVDLDYLDRAMQSRFGDLTHPATLRMQLENLRQTPDQTLEDLAAYVRTGLVRILWRDAVPGVVQGRATLKPKPPVTQSEWAWQEPGSHINYVTASQY